MKTRATLAALAMGATLSLTGCSLAANVTTANVYDPSDGIGDTIGSVSTDNFILVSTGEGEPAALIGSIHNAGAEPAKVTITIGDDAEDVVVAAGSTVALGLGEHDRAVVTTSPADPGRIAEITVEAESAGVTKAVPVLDGTQPAYQTVLDQLAALDK